MSDFDKIETELCRKLWKIIQDDDTYIGTLLLLWIGDSPEQNFKKMLDYINDHPKAGYDEVLIEADKIVGLIK